MTTQLTAAQINGTVELAPIDQLEMIVLEHDMTPTPSLMVLLIAAYHLGCEDTY
jgi:hypothetical protein